MGKKVSGFIKLQIPAGKANPSPPVGPALGQHGVNIMEFCKRFNAETDKLEAGMPLPVVITVFEDKSFTFITKTPPAPYLIKKAIGLAKGSIAPGKTSAGSIKKSQCKEIAKLKQKDLNAVDLDQASKMIEGTARSMGLEVVEG